jgi:asparagine synthase (glutamine-hydrolysing)
MHTSFWGKCSVERLNGMFVFAIYDDRTQSVFTARDRFGEKPLYSVEREGSL